MSNLTKFLALAAISLTASCGKTGEKAPNQILAKNTPETEIYTHELASLLEKTDPAKLEYYFDQYVLIEGTDYLYVTIQGAIDATAIVTVREWDKNLKPIKEFKGKGYSGAEFKNLKLEVVRDSANTAFIYKGMDEMSD